MRKIRQYFIQYPKLQYLPLVLVLAGAGYFYLHNLGTDYITLWDEAVHVNVVKNLANDLWPPKLHLTDIGIDFQDWTSNYIWVHKPLMPLYLQTLFYKLGGGSLFAFRLPAALCALAASAALFFAGRRHFGYAAALISSALFAFNPYVLELVKGRQFSGLHDLLFCLSAVLALDRVLTILDSKDEMQEVKKHYLLFGLFAGSAYLSKGGLSLLFFPALLIPLFSSAVKKKALLNTCYAGLAALLVVFPEKITLALSFPAEYAFEQRTQILHLFKDLEYWGRPWDYYLSVYLKDMLAPYVYFPSLAAFAYGLYKGIKGSRKLLVLGTWAFWFVFVLSFGVSKISNFVFAALPALLLLLGHSLKSLWPKRLMPWAITLCVIFAVGLYINANLASERRAPADAAGQNRLRRAGEYASEVLPKDSVSLIWHPEIQKSHLYFKYWSGLDALEIYDRQPIYHMENLYPERPIYVFSGFALDRPELKLIAQEDFGYVYKKH